MDSGQSDVNAILADLVLVGGMLRAGWEAVEMTQEERLVDQLVHRLVDQLKEGTRQAHRASGELWCITGYFGRDMVDIERLRDGRRRRIAAIDWINKEKWDDA